MTKANRTARRNKPARLACGDHADHERYESDFISK
jgi:hypothetical protein